MGRDGDAPGEGTRPKGSQGVESEHQPVRSPMHLRTLVRSLASRASCSNAEGPSRPVLTRSRVERAGAMGTWGHSYCVASLPGGSRHRGDRRHGPVRRGPGRHHRRPLVPATNGKGINNCHCSARHTLKAAEFRPTSSKLRTSPRGHAQRTQVRCVQLHGVSLAMVSTSIRCYAKSSLRTGPLSPKTRPMRRWSDALQSKQDCYQCYVMIEASLQQAQGRVSLLRLVSRSAFAIAATTGTS